VTAEPAAVPQLVHSGTYALYETPDGGRHLVYRRTASVDDTGTVREIDGAQDEHLPDIPPAAIPLIENFLANGLPPAVLAMLDGKLNPMTVLKAMRNGAG
jgi:hypothetical protein